MNRRIGLFFIVTISLLASCAKIVTPIGGPKDTQPPQITKVVPADKSTQFNNKTIKFTFNEYVVVDNPNENVVFSPPLRNQPIYAQSNKSFTIKLNDTLLPNTTYNIGFLNCVKDFTEGNPIHYLQYTFSTGDAIDSFEIRGKVTNAESLDPEKNCFVMLYDADVDSLPKCARPNYVTKTDANGNFLFQHIAGKNYKIFALNDINKNMLFDLPNEGVAFSDSLVAATVISRDSALTAEQQTSVALQFFVTKDTIQRFLKLFNPQINLYKFAYHLDIQNFSVSTRDTMTIPPHFECWNATRDTITWFLKAPITDSLPIFADADGRLDTIVLLPYKAPTQRGRGSRQKTKNNLDVTCKNGNHFVHPARLDFEFPIQPIDSFNALIISKKNSGNDTILQTFNVPDTFIKSIEIPFLKEEKVPYTIFIKDSTFFGYNGETNDSLTFNFTVKSEKEYGNLIINYLNINKLQYVVALLNQNGGVVRTDLVRESRQLQYPMLEPGNYRIKVVEDRNENGRWDSGDYDQKRQPERLFYFEKPITIRGYWDLEETFDLNKR